ncbi:energy transducer TonB [Cognatitamlana onchidii]|uniref:energy transducer TonB n=1 Tax=Cognatitamlana onchidii TaxID=2562860 RepID=UPI0010A6712A|nr:energy transducer TonB [Algibacter onchidii]
MSNLKKTHDLIRQNERVVKKSQKHDVNLQKNTTFYFQLGLIVCLLASLGLLEMTFETTIPTAEPPIIIDEPFYVHIPVIKERKPAPDEPKPQRQVKELLVFKEVPDDTFDNLFELNKPEPSPHKPELSPERLPDLPDKPEDDNVPMELVEMVPIYPGCEKTKGNEARKKCMSENISKLIQRKFEGNEIAETYGLKGKQRIAVQFKIDKTGRVTEIKTRSPHPKLDAEATRVINMIPQMKPGKQRDKNVGVIYSLPIVFKVQ